MSKRIEFLDAAKGIGILFVVLGHNPIKLDYPSISQVIYSFHMPFFFLLSGMSFNVEYGFIELARRRFKSLLKPFIAYMFVVYVGALFFTKIDLQTIFVRILKAFYAGPNTLEWVPLWFLPHMFLVNLFAFAIIKFIYNRLPHLWMRVLFLVALLGAGVAIIQFFWPITFLNTDRGSAFYGLPWSADLLLITSAFFISGYEIRRSLLDRFDGFPHSPWILVGASLLFVGLNIVFQSTIDFYTRSYGPFVVSTLEAISGSFLILYVAKWLEKGSIPIFNTLRYLGGASIILLIFHFVPQDFFYQKVTALNINTLLASALAFCAGILFPLMLYAWVIRPNILLSSWFGLSQTQEQEKVP
jgi:fucose 4-O-acetylase-like acetyltransferase